MKIIPYEDNHLNACLELFNSNEPTYFDESERAPFEKYLKGEKHSYWVLVDEGNLLACGGFEIEKPGDARIVWLMVERSKQGKGYGAALMQHFEQLILAEKKFSKISLMTAQVVNKFYEKLGYKTLKFEPKYWCDRFDLYYMEKDVVAE